MSLVVFFMINPAKLIVHSQLDNINIFFPNFFPLLDTSFKLF